MSIEGRRQIESILIREEFPKGAIALNEGEVAHEIVFVGKGMLRQYYYKNGKDVTEHFSYEGCIVMCIESFLKQVPTRAVPWKFSRNCFSILSDRFRIRLEK